MPPVAYYAILVALIANIAVSTVWVVSEFGGLKDLDSFLHSGAAYTGGLNPYGYHWWLQPSPISPEALNLNPPVSVYLFEPLAMVDRGFVGLVFAGLAISLLAISVGLLMRAYPDKRHWIFILLVAALAGVWQMLYYMQIYAPLLLAMVGAWLLLRKGDWLLAGILIGVIIAMKPNYGLVALVFLAAGHYRVAGTSVVSAGLISLIPLLVDGPHVYLQWLQLTREFDGYGWTSNASLVAVGERLGFLPAGHLAAAVVGVAVLFLAKRWRPDTLTTTAMGTMAVILVGPVSWAGYTLLLLPYLFAMRWDRWILTSVAVLAIPFAPLPALASLGIDLAGSGVSSGASEVLPPMLKTMVGAFVLPLTGALYVWAVLLMLVRLCLRLADANGDLLLLRSWWERFLRAAIPRPLGRAGAAGEPAHGAPVAIRARSDV